MIPSGKRLGHYVIKELVGAGSMGEVYLAFDEVLHRDVALKILAEAFSQDPERLRRFEHEARAAAILEHPNILAVHDFGVEDGIPYAVAELLDGQPLRQIIAGRPLPLRKILDYALQIARGLAAAHEKGLVHRDIKPENIFLTGDGRIKILDFGLVKLGQPTLSENQDPARQAASFLTLPGTVMGTVGYMSPEQVRGEDVDRRSDVFSFGVVLFEMCTGRRPFEADNAIAVINGILNDETPDLAASGVALPPGMERLIHRCLEKLPDRRCQSMNEAASALETLKDVAGNTGELLPRLAGAAGRRKARALAWVVGSVLAVLAGLALYLWLSRYPARSHEPNTAIPTFRQVTFRRGTVYTARFSPDGKTVAYSAIWGGGKKKTYMTIAENGDSRLLEWQEADIVGVSPAGEVALIQRTGNGFSPGLLSVAPLAGGPPRSLQESVSWADWDVRGEAFAAVRKRGDRRTIEYPTGTVLYTAPSPVSYPRLSPDCKQIAFIQYTGHSSDGGDLMVVDVSGRVRTLSKGWNSIEGVGWRPDGGEVWFTAAREGLACSLWGVGPDGGGERLLLQAPGRLVLHDVSRDGLVLAERNSPRTIISGRGLGARVETDFSWLDSSDLEDITPDGSLLLFSEIGEAVGREPLVYIRKTDGSPPLRLGRGVGLALSPDGKRALVLGRGTPNRLQVVPTGAGKPVDIPLGDIRSVQWGRWLPDCDRFLIWGEEEGKKAMIYRVDLAGGPPVLVSSDGNFSCENALSPDGKRLLVSRSGEWFVFFLDGGQTTPVARLGPGDRPVCWTPDGRGLYIRKGDSFPLEVYIHDLATGAQRQWQALLPADLSGVILIGNIFIARDGSYYYNHLRLLSDLYVIGGIR